jgi:hypothetical protein
MESVNPENLKAEGKGQNKVDEYNEIVDEWHRAGVVVHTGYIIGLPWDTVEGVRRDLRFLMEEIQPDQASFFMLTPLPGSHDHREMKKRGEWMDPDFNKRDSFHATIRLPRMTAEQWTQAYENAWESFYSKENMIKILSRWSDHPKRYWDLMSVFFWYKNAALIEKQHPMIAGFFRLKDRTERRTGYAIDPLNFHLWKRSKEIARLFVAWGRFLKEMEEVWLQSRKKSEKEERWLQEIQRIQGEVWQALRVAEWQRTYSNARAALPATVKALLDPFEELSTKILLTRRDLDRFLKQWERLVANMQDLRHHVTHEGEAVRRWLDELGQIQNALRSNSRLQEWRDAYSRIRGAVPFHLLHAKFDAINNQIVYSRQDLQKFWSNTIEQLRHKNPWKISPITLLTVLVKDLSLTAAFALRMKAHSRAQHA